MMEILSTKPIIFKHMYKCMSYKELMKLRTVNKQMTKGIDFFWRYQVQLYPHKYVNTCPKYIKKTLIFSHKCKKIDNIKQLLFNNIDRKFYE